MEGTSEAGGPKEVQRWLARGIDTTTQDISKAHRLRRPYRTPPPPAQPHQAQMKPGMWSWDGGCGSAPLAPTWAHTADMCASDGGWAWGVGQKASAQLQPFGGLRSLLTVKNTAWGVARGGGGGASGLCRMDNRVATEAGAPLPPPWDTDACA